MNRKLLLVFVILISMAAGYGLRSLKDVQIDFSAWLPTPKVENIQQQNVLSPLEPQAEKILYGMNLAGFILKDHKIQRNEALAGIFMNYNVPEKIAEYMVEQSRNVFNPNKIIAGTTMTVALEKEQNKEVAKKVIYDISQEEFIVFNLEDSLFVYKGKKEVEEGRREVAGEISSSLYETLSDQQVSPGMAVVLADIFKWSIDFHKIQEGDQFKIIFDEQKVEGKPIGIGKIHACVFTHKGKDFYAFAYNVEGSDKVEYYDENGNTMKQMFLKAPVKYSRISSRYTKRRFHPVSKVWKAHLGTDYAAPHGTPIIATADGVVSEACFKKYNGNYVKLKHNGTYETQYLHMSRIAKGMKRGRKVSQGEVIGYVGSTGLASGPHVCYRFWKHGKQVDALRENLKFAQPLPAGKKENFIAMINPLKATMDQLSFQRIVRKKYDAQVKEKGNKMLDRALFISEI